MKKIFVLLLCMAVLISGCVPTAATLPAQAPTEILTEASTETLPESPNAASTEILPEASTETLPESPTAQRSVIQYPDSDAMIRLSYDPALTGPAAGALVPAVANTPDQPAFMVHPALVQVQFPKYGVTQNFHQPLPLEGPRIMIYQTRDFAGYGEDSPFTYANQLTQLNALLEQGIEADRCAKPQTVEGQPLPFLPVVNAVQVFCAKPQPVTFEGGKGIRYVTYYDQGIAPKVDWYAFYTFQGRTDDGQYYISAIFPVHTNVLPNEEPVMSDQPDIKALAYLLQDQVTQINAQADDQFTPALTRLDDLIAGMKVPAE